MTKSTSLIGGMTTKSGKVLIATRIPGALEIRFSLFDQPYVVILERTQPGHYLVMLDGDVVGSIDKISKASWSTPMGIVTRSSDVAAYVTVLWYLLGKERGEL